MFNFLITADSNIESGVGAATLVMTSNGFYKFIEKQNYGEGLKKIVVVFMCRDPEINFKQRIRYSKKEQTLYFDLMLDYNQFVVMTSEQRVSEMCAKLLEEMPFIVKKYKFINFNLDKLIDNLKSWFHEQGFIIC
ncbi:hypothetical protein [Acinetobacter junii]|uniref:hypothetical protein n=1 Tax=Acinetobacter junii TaxID=40215 RepID=UPI001F34B560|nr:hypothetical protein [Acinetobacter junii]